MRQRIEHIMTDNGRSAFPHPEWWLMLISRCYGGVMAVRNTLYRRRLLTARRLPCQVISVGNLTVGGTGKTPMVRHLVNRLTGMGYRPAVISRGYRGRLEAHGGIASDTERVRLGPKDAGDEPYMLALDLPGVPVLVGRNRWQSGRAAVSAFSPDVVVLDDGYQHQSLHRDLDLVLMDARRPVGNGHIFPRGPLREPLSGLNRCDAVILMAHGKHTHGHRIGRPHFPRHVRLLSAESRPFVRQIITTGADGCRFSNHHPHEDLSVIKGRRVFALSGIARNDRFLSTIEAAGACLAGRLCLADHVEYTSAVRRRLKAAVAASNADLVVTTRKDTVKIDEHFGLDVDVIALDIEVVMAADQAAAFDALIRGVMRRGR